MKSILLTTTALVAFAGAAVAEGHSNVTLTWSGTATGGMAREGGADAGSAMTLKEFQAIAGNEAGTAAGLEEVLDSITAADVAAARKALKATLDGEKASGTAAQIKTAQALYDAETATLDAIFGSAAVATGDFDTYAEINATVVGSVALDNGMTLSAGMSVDAGTGYDFADDDGFDAAKTNGVALDHVSIDAGAFGKLRIEPNDIDHLVDDDDGKNADLLYTNTVAGVSLSFAMDVDKDTNATPSSASWSVEEDSEGQAVFDDIGAFYNAAVAADVQWSAKVAAPIGEAATVYAAFDEEKGNAFGGTFTIEGITLSASSKLEAVEEAEGTDRSNTIGASYTVGGLTAGGEWNSIEDGNQWSVNGAYAIEGITIAAGTNEGEEWEVTGSYALTDAASAVAGVNYTEDAYVGVSFSF